MARRLPKPPRLRTLPFNKMIPNFMTLLALTAGLTAIRFGLQERWEAAVVAIAVAAFFDGLDGRLARLLKGASKFGAELDSLSDFLCFGIAPAILLYLWTMEDAGRFGWILVVFFPICSAMRLARFNTALEDPDQPAWQAQFFTGVPSPAGAGMVLLPMVLSFEIGDEFTRNPWIAGLFLLGVGTMLISRVPTFSFKRVKIAKAWVMPTMLIVAIVATFAINAFWLTLSLLIVAYICSFAISILKHRKLMSEGTTTAVVEDAIDSQNDDVTKP